MSDKEKQMTGRQFQQQDALINVLTRIANALEQRNALIAREQALSAGPQSRSLRTYVGLGAGLANPQSTESQHGKERTPAARRRSQRAGRKREGTPRA